MAPGKSNLPGRRLGLREGPRREDRDHDPDRDVDEQHPAPRQVGGEQAAGDQAHRGAADAHRGVDTHRPVTRGALRERGGDQRQRRRRDDGATDPLRGAARQQPLLGGGETAEQGRHREQDDPGDEHPPPAEDVARPPAQQQQPAKGQRIGVDDPFQAGTREPESVLDMRQRHVDDRRVEHHHQLCGSDDHQGQAELAVAVSGHPARPGQAPSIRLRSVHHILLSFLMRRSGEATISHESASAAPRSAGHRSCQDGRRL